MVYAADPWAVIALGLAERTSKTDLPTSISFARQAQEYFSAADRAGVLETKPLLYYYSFLNLVKALRLAASVTSLGARVMHGLSSAYSGGPLSGAEVRTYSPRPGDVSAFDDFIRVLTGSAYHGPPTLSVHDLMAQSVVGHRLWYQAANSRERFIGIDRIRFLHEPSTREIWSTIEVRREALISRGRSVVEVLSQAALTPIFQAVTDTVDTAGRHLRRFDQAAPITYTHRSADEVVDLVEVIKPRLWRTVTPSPPFRQYYLYLSPPGDLRLPQLASIYTLTFFLGSLTRYQPKALLAILDGPYGAFLREFLATQPQQFVYGLACELKRQEVSKASLV